jgi:membrane-associated phospholipid phosphatase
MNQNAPRLFSKYRDHYRATKSEHRPVPVLLPFAAIIVLVIAALLFLDDLAAGMRGQYPPWPADTALFITDVGRSWWIITLTSIVIVVAWSLKRLSSSENIGRIAASAAAMAAYILASVGLASLIVNIIKRAIGRPRPVMFDGHGLFSFHPFKGNFDFESFPSGHATVNGALFMALALLFPRLRIPLLVAGLCLALTRVFVGAHFPSDVTAGFGFGMWFAFATALWFSRFGVLFDTKDGQLTVLK